MPDTHSADTKPEGELPLHKWLPTPRACQALGRGEKTLRRYASFDAGDKLHIRKGLIPLPGRRMLPVYHPGDIARARQHAAAEKARPKLYFSGSPAPAAAAAVTIDRKMLLTTREACELGWTLELLDRYIREGTVRQFGDDRIPRCDLDLALTIDRTQIDALPLYNEQRRTQ